LRGALNTGASAEEIEAMLALGWSRTSMQSIGSWFVSSGTDVKSESWRDVFIDRAVVHVVGGAGGAGASSFRRESSSQRWADGVDGGAGGSVLRAGRLELARSWITATHRVEAERGQHGKGKT